MQQCTNQKQIGRQVILCNEQILCHGADVKKREMNWVNDATLQELDHCGQGGCYLLPGEKSKLFLGGGDPQGI